LHDITLNTGDLIKRQSEIYFLEREGLNATKEKEELNKIIEKIEKKNSTYYFCNQVDLAPGLYNDNNELICSWEELKNQFDYTKDYGPYATNPGKAFNINSRYAKGTVLKLGEVSTIGARVFAGNTTLKRIILPDTISIMKT
jgi:hypothetical protein